MLLYISKFCISIVWLLLDNQKHSELHIRSQWDSLISFIRSRFQEYLLKILAIDAEV